MKNIPLALYLTLITFILASLGYIIITHIQGWAFGGFFRMLMYHETHPFQYIGIVATVFGVIGTIWDRYFSSSNGWKRWLSLFLCIILTLFVSSIPGGILWKIHDMQAGYFTEGLQFWHDLWWGAKEGFQLGWFIMLISMPYNLFGFLTGGLILHKLPKILSTTTN